MSPWTSALAGRLEIPVDVGVGPAALSLTGPIAQEHMVHTGVSLSVAAIIDQQTIRKHRKQIPRAYRDAAKQLSEVRISPSILIPETLVVSPRPATTSIYGVTWRPASLNLPLSSSALSVRAGVGLDLTYLLILSDTVLADPVHFLRPGVDGTLEAEIPLFSTSGGRRMLLAFGARSTVYLPQGLQGGLTALGATDGSIWHIGQATVRVHYRFPYSVTL